MLNLRPTMSFILFFLWTADKTTTKETLQSAKGLNTLPILFPEKISRKSIYQNQISIPFNWILESKSNLNNLDFTQIQRETTVWGQ